MFQKNQRQFYKELNQGGERCYDNQVEAEKLRKFWGDIWSESVNHNKNVKWLLKTCRVKSMLQNSRR